MKEQQNLVRLLDLDSDFIIDLRYATADNFTKNVVYTSSECYIDRHTGKQLIAAKNAAKEKRLPALKYGMPFDRSAHSADSGICFRTMISLPDRQMSTT